MIQPLRGSPDCYLVSSLLHTDSKAAPPSGWLCRCMGWFCGMGTSSQEQAEPSPEEKADELRHQTDITESPTWRRVVNINAIIMMALAVFLWGCYA